MLLDEGNFRRMSLTSSLKHPMSCNAGSCSKEEMLDVSSRTPFKSSSSSVLSFKDTTSEPNSLVKSSFMNATLASAMSAVSLMVSAF